MTITGTTLEIKNVEKSDQGTYSVLLRNILGMARSEATLVIKDATDELPDRIVKPLEAKLTPHGSKTELKVEFTKSDATQVKWFHNGKEVVHKKGIVIKSDEKQSILEIEKTDKTTAGKWEVHLGQEQTSSCTVRTVDKPTEDTGPKFRLHLNEKPLYSDHPNILQVQVAGKPEASFIWMKDDEIIENDENFKIHTEANKSVLFMKYAKEGNYSVRSENVFGSISSSAYFKVLEGVDERAPEFAVQLPTVVNLMDGDEVTLCCQVKKVQGPTPFVSWYKNGQLIKEKPKNIVINQTDDGVCTLKIAELFPEDSGEYLCQVIF